LSPETVGKVVIGIGLLAVVVGIVIYFLGGKLAFLGRLPGDIAIERENFRFYFPITTLVLVNGLIWVGIKVFGFFQK
jgi:hypothetical protein